MKKTLILLGGVAILVIFIFVVAGVYKFNFTNGDIKVSKNNPLNTSYTIAGQIYTLVNGQVEKEITPGSASKEVVKVFGEPVYADLNNDGVNDAVMFLTQDSGGSGTFYYAVEAINIDGAYKGTNALFLGDRIAPQNINIDNGRAVVNFAVRKEGDSFATPPSIGKSVWIQLDATKLEIGEWVKGFEGEVDVSKMNLQIKNWNWIKTVSVDGKEIIPKNVSDFILTFKNDKTFGAKTDCNGVGGNYEIVGSKITFSKMISTLMFCEGSLEQDFTKSLADAVSYSFTSKGELVLILKSGGSMVLK